MEIVADIKYTAEMGHQEMSTIVYSLRVTRDDERTPPDTRSKVCELLDAFENRRRAFEGMI